jgi:hypothetical protein
VVDLKLRAGHNNRLLIFNKKRLVKRRLVNLQLRARPASEAPYIEQKTRGEKNTW